MRNESWYMCDHCNNAVNAKSVVVDDVIAAGEIPAALRGLTFHERRLLPLVETNVVLVHMPKGNTTAQKVWSVGRVAIRAHWWLVWKASCAGGVAMPNMGARKFLRDINRLIS